MKTKSKLKYFYNHTECVHSFYQFIPSHKISLSLLSTLWAIKKRDTFIFSITQTNIDRFSQGSAATDLR